MTRASPLGLRLFLEGIEVPVISAQVQMQPNSPASASIQIVPTNAGLSLLPRTLVHLFYLDDKAPRTDAEESVDEETIDRPTLNRIEAPDKQYKLMFCGEVIGFNFQKTPISRALVLQCMDLSSYWDTCYQWFADWSVGGNALTDRVHSFVGAGTGLFDNVAGDPKSVIASVLRSKPKNPAYRKTSGLLGGMISLMETVGGIKPQKGSFRGYRGANDFFSIAELRYQLTGQIGALSDDKTSSRIYSSKAFISWLKRGISSLGSLVSFRQIIMHVSRYVFHDIYPNTSPFYIPADTTDVWVRLKDNSKVQKGTDASKKLKEAVTNLQTALKRLNSGLESTDKDLGPAFLQAAAKFSEKARKKVGELAAEGGLPQDVKNGLTIVDVKLLDVYLKAGEKSPTSTRIKANADKIKSRLSSSLMKLRELLKAQTTMEVVKAKTPGSKKITVQTGGHLFTQLVLPESFFLPPPRCNVLFPDQYTQFSFSRNFAQEVTRLSCSGGLGIFVSGGSSARRLLGSYYYAPNIKAASGNITNTYWKGGKTILPHEIHSGIIPKFEWVQHGHRWGAREARKKGVKNVPYIQRLANFQFFMHRWMSRTMSVTCTFNPRLILGLPALVIDRSAPAPAALKEIEETVGQSVLPTQFLGKIASLSHDVNQSGGQTMASMTHCRTHRSLDDEFVGILDRNTYTSSKERLTVTDFVSGEKVTLARDDKKARLMRKITEALTMKSVVIVSGQEVLDVDEDGIPDGASVAVEETSKEFSAKPLIQTYVKGYGTLKEITFSGFQTLTSDQIRSMGVAPESLDTSLRQSPASNADYNFPEKVVIKYVYVTGETRTERPLEELIMPGWYDPVWKLDKIGEKAYAGLIGCGAITDDVEMATEFVKDSLYYKDFDFSGPATEKAVDGLSMMYGVVKEKGLDVHEFIRNYTDRPIANLVDILGSADYDPDTGAGTEGFHSNAFGDYNADVVFNAGSAPTPGKDTSKPPQKHLVPEGAKIPERSRTGRKVPKIPKYLDPRGRARLRVKAYMAELSLSRGLQG